MKAWKLIAVPLALGALALPVTAGDKGDKHGYSDAESTSVKKLKSSLRPSAGFKVESVHVADSGVACINYRVRNDTGGDSRDQAVVDGDTVLRASSRNERFEEIWNRDCAGETPETTASD